MTKVGVGHRIELAPWIDSGPPEIECLEITAEHFTEPKRRHRLRTLAQKYPVMLHSLGLSLGTPGPLDPAIVRQLADIAVDADPLWISDHIGFCRTDEVDLGHFNPVRPEPDTVRFMADHAREVAEACGRPMILENITADLQIHGSLSETEFLNRLSEESGCGLLLDVTNLFVNCRNRGIDPYAWFCDIDADRIVQLHVVGYTQANGRWHDFHERAIQDELWQLMCDVLAYAAPQAVIIERDGNFPAIDEIESELRRIKAAVEQSVRHGNRAGSVGAAEAPSPGTDSPGR